jgi:hypothetical protein
VLLLLRLCCRNWEAACLFIVLDTGCPARIPAAAELAKGKHSTVCSYLDTRSGHLVAVKTYYKRTMAKRHYRNVRREIAINKMLAKQR